MKPLDALLVFWYISGVSHMLDIDISAEKWKINKGNRFQLTCFSCWKSSIEGVNIFVNNILADSIRYYNGQCYHKRKLCTPESCTCSARGRSFTWTFISDLSNIQFSCEMRFKDEIKSTTFVQIAELTFNGTVFIKNHYANKSHCPSDKKSNDDELNLDKERTNTTAAIEFLNQTDDNTIYGHEGENISITCVALQGEYGEGLSIKQNLTTLSASDSNIVTYSFKANRHEHHKEYECVAKETLLEVNVTLLVYYAPDVQVFATEKHSLNCIANGFPNTYTFNKWEHLSEKGEHVRYLVGFNNGTLHLENLRHQYQISGRYICSVSNGIPDVDGNMLQNGSESLRFIGHPIFAYENRYMKVAQLFKPITLSFLLYSEPIVDNIVVVGVADHYTKNETIHDFRISETDLMYKDFGQKGKIRGFEFSLDFKMISKDYRTYTIWANNLLGGGSFSFKVRAVGTPMMTPELDLEHAEYGQPAMLKFVLCSNFDMEDIWIEVDRTGHNQTKTKDAFNISKNKLLYTAFGNTGGNVSSYEIIFETSMEVHKYIVWTKHEFGVDFYGFEIRELESLKSNRNENSRFIIISGVAASLLVYISVIHICFRVKCRSLRSSKRTAPDDLQYHMYDDIDSVAYQAVNSNRFAASQPGLSNQTRIVHSSQTSIDNQQTVPITSELYLTVLEKESLVNDEHHNGIAAATLNISSSSSEDIKHSGRNHGEGIDTSSDSSQLYPITRHRDEQLSTNFGMSIDSASSEDSKVKLFEPASGDVNCNDGYENPYQLVIHESQPIHQYRSIINQSEHQDEQLFTTYRTSIDSASSEDSKIELFDPASGDVNGNDGYENPYQLVIQESQPIHQYSSIINQSEHQDKQLTTSYGTPIDSASSEDSEMELSEIASGDVNGNDGYENPYQIVIQESQPIHQYSSIINQSEHIDSVTPTDIRDYINLQF